MITRIIFLFIPFLLYAQFFYDVTVKVKVIGEDGNAIADAEVGVGIGQGGNAWIGEGKTENFRGRTDSNGVYMVRCRGTGSIGVSAKKEGYYDSWQHFYFYRLGERHDGDWKPFDPERDGITMILRKRVNPIPMYAKKVETKIPQIGKPCGYDLFKGDWVQPYGRGIISDFIFCVDGYWNNNFDNEANMELSFNNDLDGIQEVAPLVIKYSKFISPRIAPESEYKMNKIWRKIRKKDTNGVEINLRDYDKEQLYVFRVRSEREVGTVKRTFYGKIYGDIEFGGAALDGSYLRFTYYLNPNPNDRNLEFDPKKNLFTDLKSFEEVTEP